MDLFLVQAEGLFHYFVAWGILLLEFFGTLVLLITGIKSIIKWLKKSPEVRMEIAQGILLALAFKMGGEVLRTVVATETKELVSIFAIILLRGLVAAMIYWEVGKEKRLEKEFEDAEKHNEPRDEKETVQI